MILVSVAVNVPGVTSRYGLQGHTEYTPEEKHIHVNKIILYDCAMAQAVRNQPLTTEAYVQTQASPCWMCSELRKTGTGNSV
jgi:hypothetical protein